MVQAFVFDCFGVLCSDGLIPFFNDYLARDPELLAAAKHLSQQVDSGKADYDEFIRELSLMAQVSERVARDRIEHNVPDLELFAFIQKVLKPKYKIGFLSNAGRDWLGEIFEPWQIALFDAVVLSFEIQCTKPEPEAYEAVAEKLGVPPQVCVMVDDSERYIEGAKGVGMQTILYSSFADFKQTSEKSFLRS